MRDMSEKLFYDLSFMKTLSDEFEHFFDEKSNHMLNTEFHASLWDIIDERPIEDSIEERSPEDSIEIRLWRRFKCGAKEMSNA